MRAESPAAAETLLPIPYVHAPIGEPSFVALGIFMIGLSAAAVGVAILVRTPLLSASLCILGIAPALFFFKARAEQGKGGIIRFDTQARAVLVERWRWLMAPSVRRLPVESIAGVEVVMIALRGSRYDSRSLYGVRLLLRSKGPVWLVPGAGANLDYHAGVASRIQRALQAQGVDVPCTVPAARPSP
jgi:hypothetical protein